jgi:hypothetical protein
MGTGFSTQDMRKMHGRGAPPIRALAADDKTKEIAPVSSGIAVFALLPLASVQA